MERIDFKEIESKEDEIQKRILDGAVFVYGTDTIYGIGCDATNFDAVGRLRTIKSLPGEKPLSVIAPSKEWVQENCVMDDRVKEWLDKLPGAYTLVIKMKNNKCVAKNVAFGTDALGIRIPDHWISKISSILNIPIVTTSANIFGQKNMTCLANLDKHIKNKVDFMIDEGIVVGKASKIVFLNEKEVSVKER